MSSRSDVAINMALVRHYLRHAVAADGEAVLRDAFRLGDPGALALVTLATQVRFNRRSRRSVATWRDHHLQRGPKERWYTWGVRQLFAMMPALRGAAAPDQDQLADADLPLTRRERRALAPTGMVDPNLPAIHEQARAAWARIWHWLPGGRSSWTSTTGTGSGTAPTPGTRTCRRT